MLQRSVTKSESMNKHGIPTNKPVMMVEKAGVSYTENPNAPVPNKNNTDWRRAMIEGFSGDMGDGGQILEEIHKENLNADILARQDIVGWDDLNKGQRLVGKLEIGL